MVKILSKGGVKMTLNFYNTIFLKNKCIITNAKQFVLSIIKYIQNDISEYTECDITIHIEYSDSDVYYSLEEFKNNFSNKSGYNELSISLFSQVHNYIIINMNDKNIDILLSTSTLNNSQSEELLERLFEYIDLLIKKSSNYKYCKNKTATKGIDDTKYNPWYKSSIFWAIVGSVATIVSTIITLIVAFK